MTLPKLRFGAYSSNWIPSKIGDIATVTSGGTPSRDNKNYWGGNIPWVTTSEIKYKNIYDSREKITAEGLKHSSAKLFNPGTILMAMYGQGNTRGDVAKLEIEAATNQACAAIIPHKDFDVDFIFQYLIRQYEEIRGMSNEGGQKNLSGSIVKNISLHFPELLEQKKIASFFSAVDKKISLLTKKHELLIQYKKGVMQKIFSQEIRFKDKGGKDFPEWGYVKLEDIAYSTTGSSNRVDSSLDGQYTFFDRSVDIRTSDKFLFDCEAIIVGGEGQSFIPKYFVGKFDLHQRAYAIKDFKNCDGKYIYYHIDHFRNYFLSKAVGSTVKSLRLPMFNEMPVGLPSIDEQKKISAFLTNLDEKIATSFSLLKLCKQYKQGLLQQMFI